MVNKGRLGYSRNAYDVRAYVCSRPRVLEGCHRFLYRGNLKSVACREWLKHFNARFCAAEPAERNSFFFFSFFCSSNFLGLRVRGLKRSKAGARKAVSHAVRGCSPREVT